MPPFEYSPYRNRYVTTIADLIGGGDSAEAQALIEIARLKAGEKQARARAWGGAVDSIGGRVSGAIDEYNSPEAKNRREIEEAINFVKEREAGTRDITDSIYNARSGVPMEDAVGDTPRFNWPSTVATDAIQTPETPLGSDDKAVPPSDFTRGVLTVEPPPTTAGPVAVPVSDSMSQRRDVLRMIEASRSPEIDFDSVPQPWSPQDGRTSAPTTENSGMLRSLLPQPLREVSLNENARPRNAISGTTIEETRDVTAAPVVPPPGRLGDISGIINPNVSLPLAEGRYDPEFGALDLPGKAPYVPASISEETRQVGRYMTDKGLFNPRLADEDMKAGGISPDIRNQVLGMMQETNAILTDFDSLTEKGDEDDAVLVGRLADQALKMSAGAGIDLQASISANLIPLERVYGAEMVNELRVGLHDLTEDQQRGFLSRLIADAEQIIGPLEQSRTSSFSSQITGESQDPSRTPLEQAEQNLFDAKTEEEYKSALVVLDDLTGRGYTEWQKKNINRQQDYDEKVGDRRLELDALTISISQEELNLARQEDRAKGRTDEELEEALTIKATLIDVARNLFDSKGIDYFGKYYGTRKHLPWAYDERVNSEALLGRLTALATVGNLDKMTGVLSESDIKLLTNISTDLHSGMSAKLIKERLAEIIKVASRESSKLAEQLGSTTETDVESLLDS